MTSIFALNDSQIGFSGETSYNTVFSVACDSTGNVYIGGKFSGTSTFGTGGNVYTSINSGSNISGFIAKYNFGNLATVSQFSQIGLGTDTGSNNAEVFSIACDSTGNVYICGFFQGGVTFGTFGITQNSPLGSSGYVAKYTLGNLATVSQFSQIGSVSNPVNSSTSGVVCDSIGNVYVSGNFNGASTFGTSGQTLISTGGGGNNSGFVVKYLNLSTAPIPANISQIGLTSDPVSGSGNTTGIACDLVGNIYVCGDFSRTITFGNLGSPHTSAGFPGNSGYVIKYLNLTTVSQFSQIGLQSQVSVNNALGIACDLTGNVYICGKFSSGGAWLAPTTFGTGGPTLTPASNYSGFVVKYLNLTTVLQISQIGLQGETTYNDVLGVTCDLTGNIYICGIFGVGSSTFGAGGPQLTSVSSAQSGYMLKYLNLNLVSKYSQIGLSSEISGNSAKGVACDLNGNVYVCGEFGDINTIASVDTTFGTGGPTLASNLNLSGFVVNYIVPPICYNRGTRILCENGYRLIEDLKIGDLVQTYLHGNLPIECIKSNKMINNPDKWSECMYRLPLTEFDDLIVTGGHGILKNTINNLDSDKMWINSYRFSKIGRLFLHRAAFCKDFIKIQTAEQFEYYHLSLKGKNNKRYGIWANGVLSESTFKSKVI